MFTNNVLYIKKDNESCIDKTGQLVTNNQPQVKLQFFDNKVIHKKELITSELYIDLFRQNQT